jgi:hypothetical protein
MTLRPDGGALRLWPPRAGRALIEDGSGCGLIYNLAEEYNPGVVAFSEAAAINSGIFSLNKRHLGGIGP